MTEADEIRTRDDRGRAARLASGDMDALADIYDAYSGPLFRLALGITGSVPDAEDVLSNVFLKLVRRRGGAIQNLRAYLFTATRHEAYSSLRLRRRETPAEEPLLYTPPVTGTGDSHDIMEALRSLPPDQREVVVLKVYEQMTFEEIGERMRASGNTVASRYRYALKKLRALLGDPIHAR